MTNELKALGKLNRAANYLGARGRQDGSIAILDRAMCRVLGEPEEEVLTPEVRAERAAANREWDARLAQSYMGIR